MADGVGRLDVYIDGYIVIDMNIDHKYRYRYRYKQIDNLIIIYAQNPY